MEFRFTPIGKAPGRAMAVNEMFAQGGVLPPGEQEEIDRLVNATCGQLEKAQEAASRELMLEAARMSAESWAETSSAVSYSSLGVELVLLVAVLML